MEKQRVILFLNRLLANYFVMHTKFYRYQWFAKGPHVVLLKNTFASFQTKWQPDLQLIADHILYLNGKPFATMVKFIKESSIEEAQADDIEKEMFTQINQDLRQIVHEIKEEGIPLARKANDDYTVYFLLSLQTNISYILATCNDISFD